MQKDEDKHAVILNFWKRQRGAVSMEKKKISVIK